MRASLAVFIVCFFTTPAWCGAWMREEGTGFSALSSLYKTSGDSDHGSYLEYGVRPDLTLGFKFDYALRYEGITQPGGTVFFRHPLPAPGEALNMSYSLGVSVESDDVVVNTSFLTQLSLGRGFQMGPLSGWVSVDAARDWALSGQLDEMRLDTTVGFNLTDQFQTMLQVFVGYTDEPTFTFAPSIVVKPFNNGMKFQIGIEAKEEETSLRLSHWTEF